MLTTRYNVSPAADPADTTVAWTGPRGVRAELLDDGFRVALQRGDFRVADAGPVLDGELGMYDEDVLDLGLDAADVASLGRQAARALAVRRAAVTRCITSRKGRRT